EGARFDGSNSLADHRGQAEVVSGTEHRVHVLAALGGARADAHCAAQDDPQVAVVAANALDALVVVQPPEAGELREPVEVSRRDVSKMLALLQRSPDGDGLPRPRRGFRRRPRVHAALALLLDFLRQVLVDERDLDAPVLAPAFGIVVRCDRRIFAAPRRGQTLGRYARGLQKAHHRRGARGRELPVRGKLRRGDRHVVGVADDANDLVVVALERLADLLQDFLAGVLERRLAGIEEELLGHLHRQHVLVLAYLELALLHLFVEVAQQAVVLRLGLLVRRLELRLLPLQAVDFATQVGLLLLERGALRLKLLGLLVQPVALLLKRVDLLVLVGLQLLKLALADATAGDQRGCDHAGHYLKSCFVHDRSSCQSPNAAKLSMSAPLFAAPARCPVSCTRQIVDIGLTLHELPDTYELPDNQARAERTPPPGGDPGPSQGAQRAQHADGARAPRALDPARRRAGRDPLRGAHRLRRARLLRRRRPQGARRHGARRLANAARALRARLHGADGISAAGARRGERPRIWRRARARAVLRFRLRLERRALRAAGGAPRHHARRRRHAEPRACRGRAAREGADPVGAAVHGGRRRRLGHLQPDVRTCLCPERCAGNGKSDRGERTAVGAPGQEIDPLRPADRPPDRLPLRDRGLQPPRRHRRPPRGRARLQREAQARVPRQVSRSFSLATSGWSAAPAPGSCRSA